MWRWTSWSSGMRGLNAAPQALKLSLKLVVLIAVTGAFAACLEQYNTKPFNNQISDERVVASRPAMRLTEEGKIPDAGAGEEQFDIGELYGMYCATCHGATGKGDGPGSAIEPKPRNFADAAWQASVADDHIEKVIRDGGPSVGMAVTMAPWGAVLSDAKLKAMVIHVRSFKP